MHEIAVDDLASLDDAGGGGVGVLQFHKQRIDAHIRRQHQIGLLQENEGSGVRLEFTEVD